MSTISAVMPSCLAPRAMAVGIGPHEEQPPPGEVGGRRPDLRAVDDVLVAVGDGERAQVGEVAAGLGLGEALAPVLGGADDAGQPPLLHLAVTPTA